MLPPGGDEKECPVTVQLTETQQAQKLRLKWLQLGFSPDSLYTYSRSAWQRGSCEVRGQILYCCTVLRLSQRTKSPCTTSSCSSTGAEPKIQAKEVVTVLPPQSSSVLISCIRWSLEHTCKNHSFLVFRLFCQVKETEPQRHPTQHNLLWDGVLLEHVKHRRLSLSNMINSS